MFDSAHAMKVAEGLKAWLAAIPDNLWNMFMFCFLGYTGSRTLEKHFATRGN